jgi:hypothetical protein
MNMKWGIVKWTLGLLLVFGLILATNLIDKKNFNKVADALESIYEDRLVAKGFIYELSLLIHDKELAIAASDTTRYKQGAADSNVKIGELMARYSETNLTGEEVEAFDRLAEDLEKLRRIEGRVLSDKSAPGEKDNITLIKAVLTQIREDLHILSKIQISEGERQMQKGKSAVESIGFLTQMEIYLLIGLGIVIQILLIKGFSSSTSTVHDGEDI